MQYLQKSMGYEIDFLPADKHIYKPKLPKTKSLLFLCNILRKKWMTKLIFCMQVSMKTYYKLILWFWWRWSSIFKVPKITSLYVQYLKQKLEMKLIFCKQINIKVAYKLISTLWASKFATQWYYDYWYAWWSILKLLKATNFQIFAIYKKS